MYYYKYVKDDKIIGIESKSVDATSPNFIKATKTECDSFIGSLPEPIKVPARDLAAEIDALKVEVASLKAR